MQVLRIAAFVGSPAKATLLGRIAARAPTYWRYLRENPSWLLMFVFARTLSGRAVERHLRGASYQRPAPVSETLFADADLPGIVRELVQEGVSLRLKLPEENAAKIVDFANENICFSRDNQSEGFLHSQIDEFNRRRASDVIAGHYFETIERCSEIAQVSKDRALLSVARAYLGCEPVLIRTRLWWSFPAARVSDAELHAAAQEKYHFDLNGWRTLKFFFYLTPTGERDGAHRCIPKSHRRRRLSHQLTPLVGQPLEELEAYYGKENFLCILGDAGSGFAEDPFLFHTGSLSRGRPRLILEIEFGSQTMGPSYRYGRLG